MMKDLISAAHYFGDRCKNIHGFFEARRIPGTRHLIYTQTDT